MLVRDRRLPLYFVAGGSSASLVAVSVKPARGREFDWAPPVRLFGMAPYVRSTSRGYDVAPDGRFLFVAAPSSLTATERAPIHFIANWFEDLRARVK